MKNVGRTIRSEGRALRAPRRSGAAPTLVAMLAIGITLAMLVSTALVAMIPAAAAPTSARITNGTQTEPFEYPSIVGLITKDQSDFAGHSCSATSISSTWLLSAASCFWDTSTNTAMTTSPYDALVGGWYLPNESGSRIDICEVVVHPDFDFFSLDTPDVAVLRLCDAHFLPAAQLPTPAEPGDGAGTPVDVVGWGLIENDQYTGQQQVGELTILSPARCAVDWDGLIDADYTTQMCAGGIVDVCNGDFGGPMYNGTTVVGIASYNPEDYCEDPAPSLFMRVSAFVDWIGEMTGVVPGTVTTGVACGDRYATHVGTFGDDVIETGDRADTVVTYGGDDRIITNGGDDVVCAGPGNDVIGLGDGAIDIAYGGPGDDLIYGNAGDDLIFGELGDDKLRGGPGNDEVDGGDGIDDVSGSSGNDIVLGGPGADKAVRGGTGDDIVDGGSGDDLLIAGNGGLDQVRGGSGNDQLVTGGPRPDTVSGGLGNDTIKGLKGADILNGDDGDDTITGGHQPDTIDGGPGIDSCNGSTTGAPAIEADTAINCEEVRNVP